jgi:hypothetical protein
VKYLSRMLAITILSSKCRITFACIIARMQIKRTTPGWAIPLAFLLLLLLSFGLMIPWLGFYWDDWPIVLAKKLQGVGVFWEYYGDERPFNPPAGNEAA